MSLSQPSFLEKGDPSLGRTEIPVETTKYTKRTYDHDNYKYYSYVPKTHKRLKRMLFNQTKQDNIRIFEEILFFKATYNTKTNNSLIFCQERIQLAKAK